MSRVYNDYYFAHIQFQDEEYENWSDALPVPTEQELLDMEALYAARQKTQQSD